MKYTCGMRPFFTPIAAMGDRSARVMHSLVGRSISPVTSQTAVPCVQPLDDSESPLTKPQSRVHVLFPSCAPTFDISCRTRVSPAPTTFDSSCTPHLWLPFFANLLSSFFASRNAEKRERHERCACEGRFAYAYSRMFG